MVHAEEWRPVKYRGEYLGWRLEVSDTGKLRNAKTKHEYATSLTENGYKVATISLGSKNVHRRIKIHRAVAESFLDPVPGKTMINHKDGNKLNNNVSNLEFCNAHENAKHAIKLGLMKILHRLRKYFKRTMKTKVLQRLHLRRKPSAFPLWGDNNLA